MKKNVMMRIASVLMIAVLLTTCVISGTFAKYASEATGTTSVTVAKWNVTLDDEKFEDFEQFDFFATADLANVKGNKLAPGTAGSFSFELANNSDVTAAIKIKLSGLSALKNFITFKLGAETLSFDGEGNLVIQNTLGFADDNKTATITVNWSWAFENPADAPETPLNDYADNALGAAGATYDVTATITAVQVD